MAPGDKKLYVLGGLYSIQDVCFLDLESERGRGTLARHFVDCALYKVCVWDMARREASLETAASPFIEYVSGLIQRYSTGRQNEWKEEVRELLGTKKRSLCRCSQLTLHFTWPAKSVNCALLLT